MKKILAVGTILLFIGVAVAPSINFSVVKASNDNYQIQYSDASISDSVIWDNGRFDEMTSDAYSSQFDTAYPYQSQAADDFILDSDLLVTGVLGWGYFISNPPYPNPSDFNIIFYADDGSGSRPTGSGMNDPTSTALAVYFVPNVYGTFCEPHNTVFEYNITLPEPFPVTADTKYWVVIQIIADYPPEWLCFTNGNNPDHLHCSVQGFPVCSIPYWTDIPDGDMAFVLFGGPIPPSQPDLTCYGLLSWDRIKPGETVTGSFHVMNIGEPQSQLNWTIASYPDWGTWTFSPSTGQNLTPEQGAFTVNVEVTAPDVQNNEFRGWVTVVNMENSSDFCIIPVTLKTPTNQNAPFIHFWELILKNFPLLQQLIFLIGNHLGRNT